MLTPTTFADGGLGSGSLRDAILQFNADTGTDDDIIQLEAGTYSLTIQNSGGHHETAGLTGDLNLTQTSHHWIIQGAGPSTIIDASLLQDRVFQIVNPGTQVVFQDLVIQGGLAQDNGLDGALAGTTDALGGGILNNGGTVTLDHVVLQNNKAQGGYGTQHHVDGFNARGGGLYSTGGSLTISDSSVASNQAVGGAGRGDGFTTVGGSGAGGGIFTSGGLLSLINTTLCRNTVRGGIGSHSGSDLFQGDTGGDGQGGGLYASSGIVSLTNATVSENTATGGYGRDFGGASRGGGLYVTGTLTISNSTVTGNTLQGGSGNLFDGTSQGGGVYGNGTVTVTNSTIATNSLQGGSGGAYGGNGGAAQGGGVYGNGTLTVSNSTIAANTLQGGNGGAYSPAGNGGAAQGGGVYGNGTLTVRNSTIAANTLQGGNGGAGSRYGGNGETAQGGALYVVSGFGAHVTFSTIATNQATGGTHGSGPVGNGSDGPATGGGVYNQGMLQTDDTILAGNTITGPGVNTSPDLAGNLGSLGHNLIGNSGGGSGYVATDLLDLDPKLGPLQDNGGPTKTMALLVGSPALNAGDPAQLGVPDQRGVIRSGGVNIGAYQASASAFVVTVSGAVPAGTPFDVTVQAVDVFGQVALGYRGTVTFRVTDPDPAVVLPADYTFTADDEGTHTFTGEFTLITPGMWTLTAADLANGLSQDLTVTVDT
jgi:hypothetical protein